MASPSKRAWIIEPPVVEGPEGAYLDDQFDMARAHELLGRLLGTLAEIGGMVSLATDRVKVGEGPGGEAIAVSQRLIVEWQAFSPMREDKTPGSDSSPTNEEPNPEPEHFEDYGDEEDPEPLRVGADVEDPWDDAA